MAHIASPLAKINLLGYVPCFVFIADINPLLQIHDTKNLMVIKTYTTETPLNSAAIAPTRPYVGVYVFTALKSANYV